MIVKDQLCKLAFTYIPSFFSAKKAGVSDIGLSMLICHKDVTMALYSLQSLFFEQGYALPVYAVDDGTLTPNDYKLLKSLFTITIDTKQKVLSKIKKQFAESPLLLKYLSDEKNHIKRMKVAALLLSPFQKVICLEPDVLFFNFSTEIELFRKGQKNYFGTLHRGVYEIFVHDNMMEMHFRKLLYLHLKLNIDFLFNGGFMLFNMRTLDEQALVRIEEAIQVFYAVDYARMFYAEETILAMLYDKKNSIVLTYPKYINLVYPLEWKKTLLNEAVNIHFISPTRLLFMYQAVKLARRTHFFNLA